LSDQAEPRAKIASGRGSAGAIFIQALLDQVQELAIDRGH
jgi:hypothetical protein